MSRVASGMQSRPQVEAPSRRVLIAEDETIIAMMLEDFLSDEGFRVTVAHDGVEALETARTQRFDILVTDLRMPRLDGASLIRSIRAFQPALPVIILTSHAPMEWRSWGETGPIVLLEKPLAMPTLARQIRGMLSADGANTDAVSPAGWQRTT